MAGTLVTFKVTSSRSYPIFLRREIIYIIEKQPLKNGGTYCFSGVDNQLWESPFIIISEGLPYLIHMYPVRNLSLNGHKRNSVRQNATRNFSILHIWLNLPPSPPARGSADALSTPLVSVILNPKEQKPYMNVLFFQGCFRTWTDQIQSASSTNKRTPTTGPH